MYNQITVGEAIALFLENCGVSVVFGVISIHNIPILQAINYNTKIRYISARSEAGAVNMADAFSRVKGHLGVVFTSTGTAAGNASGAILEALDAGSPVLHITGQIETPYLDQNTGYLHEAPDQLSMLKSISKLALRVRCVNTALSTIREAARIALTAPTGPVSVEIPIDIQSTLINKPTDIKPPIISIPAIDKNRINLLANELVKSHRPLLWLGGGARNASNAIYKLLNIGFGVVSTIQGRGIVSEDNLLTLGAHNSNSIVEAFYSTCDSILVVGSKLRSNETSKYKLKLPIKLYRIDINGLVDGRNYKNKIFIQGDAQLLLDNLYNKLINRMTIDPAFHKDLLSTRNKCINNTLINIGIYSKIASALHNFMIKNHVNWVRDVTLLNSIWGNRSQQIFSPRSGIHAVGGGIGQGVQMAIGAALADNTKKTICLVGDGGLMLNVGELATLVQEKVNVLIILMNDQCYGVIRNIQKVQGHKYPYYVNLHQPNFSKFCESLQLPYCCILNINEIDKIIEWGINFQGPVMIEVNMKLCNSFLTNFIGPSAHV